MKTLLCIRHAQSEANKKRILGSQLPFPLTPEGKADAALIAQQLRSLYPVTKIITSPLLRATQTAEAFQEVYGITYSLDARLVEQNLGSFSGMGYDEVKELSSYEHNTLDRWDWVPAGGGESYAMIAERVENFLKELVSPEESHGESHNDEQEQETILIVTHAVVFRILRAILKNTIPLYEAGFPNNGEIWKIAFTKPGDQHSIESLFLGSSSTFVHNP